MPVRQSEPLAERIATLAKDADLCAQMGRAGRAKAEAEFSIEFVASEILKVYARALQG